MFLFICDKAECMMLPDNIKEIFKDIKIVELSSVLAGPLVGSYFAELGAEVIKIENKRSAGDVTRTWYLTGEDRTRESAYYQAANYGKESVFLDLRDDEDRAQLYAHIKTADIVLNNNNLKSAVKLGTDPAHLRKLKPDLIYAQLDGFDGDEMDRVAYDLALQAESGFLSMTGVIQEDKTDVSENNLAKMPVAFIDVLAAHQLKEAILVALLKKLKTGQGTYLRASLYGVALTSQKNQATNYLLAGYIPGPMGTLHPNIAPYGEILNFKDRVRIILAIGSDQQFTQLIDILRVKDIDLKLFMTNVDRVARRGELLRILNSAASVLNSEEIIWQFTKYNVPYGRIRNLNEVWEEKTAQPYINKNRKTPLHSAIEYRELHNI